MHGDLEYMQDVVSREWRRKHRVRFALTWLGILAMCLWCVYTGASAVVGYLFTNY